MYAFVNEFHSFKSIERDKLGGVVITRSFTNINLFVFPVMFSRPCSAESILGCWTDSLMEVIDPLRLIISTLYGHRHNR